MSPADLTNPVTAGHGAPQWAQLTRLAGDRAAILFEDLRRRVGAIPGLIEELHYDAVEKRWMPRYRLREDVLFTAHILPAALEVSTTLGATQRDRLLASRQLGSAMKQLIRQAPAVDGVVSVRVRLSRAAAVRAFATLVTTKAKLMEAVRSSG